MYSRNFKSSLLLALFVLLLGGAVKAQDIHVVAQVPFEFKAGELTMPLGEYQLSRLNSLSNSVFRIRGENAVAARITMRTYSKKVKEQSVLIFNKYQEAGGEVSYFLAQLWVAGDNLGFEFPKSRAERSAASRAAQRDIITLVVRRAAPPAE